MAYSIDVNVPKVVVVGTASILLLVIIGLATHGFYLWLDQREFAIKNFDYVNPQLTALNKEYGQHLHSYKWVDASTGTAQIPIDHAITLLAQRQGVAPTTQPLGRP